MENSADSLFSLIVDFFVRSGNRGGERERDSAGFPGIVDDGFDGCFDISSVSRHFGVPRFRQSCEISIMSSLCDRISLSNLAKEPRGMYQPRRIGRQEILKRRNVTKLRLARTC